MIYYAHGLNNLLFNECGTFRAFCCQHEFTVLSAPYGQAVQGHCRKCGFLPPPGYMTCGPAAPASKPMNTYSDEEIERIKREAFDAGRNASIDDDAKIATLIYARIRAAEPEEEIRHSLPIHRAIANHRRVGNVYAHRAYWLPND